MSRCSGRTPEPTIRDETADDSDDSPAEGIKGHADQQECQHHQGCAAFPVAVDPCDHDFGTESGQGVSSRSEGRAAPRTGEAGHLLDTDELSVPDQSP